MAWKGEARNSTLGFCVLSLSCGINVDRARLPSFCDEISMESDPTGNEHHWHSTYLSSGLATCFVFHVCSRCESLAGYLGSKRIAIGTGWAGIGDGTVHRLLARTRW